jgi:hypothetical protein
MPRKKHTPEQIITRLREAEVAMSTGNTVADLTLDNQILKEAADGKVEDLDIMSKYEVGHRILDRVVGLMR